MADDLQTRLRRLGVVKGTRSIKPAPSAPEPVSKLQVRARGGMVSAATTPSSQTPETVSLETLMPTGRIESNEYGEYYVVDTVYPRTHVHGGHAVETLLEHNPTHLNAYLNKNDLEWPTSFADCLFIDTETTGLAGANTVAFMVGVGFYEANVFVVRQYFMRDFGDEAALLHDLQLLVDRYPYLISFNGKTFDIPLLQTRFLMNRMIDPFQDRANIDLLHPARRIWRRRFGSCSLGSLEEQLLGIRRTQQDVPGHLIPMLYHNYVRSGDARDMVRVFYHNLEDIVSLVSVATELLQLLEAPDLCEQAADLYSLGRWMAALDMPLAEPFLRQAASIDTDVETWHAILLQLGALLKRQDRRAEAVPLWLQVAHTAVSDTSAHVELAKFYEWHERNLPEALNWTERAIDLLQSYETTLLSELTHRKKRVENKLKNSSHQRETPP